MFAVTSPNQSDAMLEELKNIQKDLFSPLGLHMKVLDMPPHELGAPAYRYFNFTCYTPQNAMSSLTFCHRIRNAHGSLDRYNITVTNNNNIMLQDKNVMHISLPSYSPNWNMTVKLIFTIAGK